MARTLKLNRKIDISRYRNIEIPKEKKKSKTQVLGFFCVKNIFILHKCKKCCIFAHFYGYTIDEVNDV